MAEDCCKLVGNLNLGLAGCIISVSTNCNTEVITACGDESPLEGPTIGNLSISGYGSETLWKGCSCRAGITTNFIRKYDCESNTVYLIFAGQGQSFYTGEADSFVTLSTVFPTECISINAGSQSGPSTVYAESTQVNGYGMSYSGGPISFTTDKLGTKITLGMFGECYLQNFSLDLQPGQLPVASYSFVYAIGSSIVGG